MTGTIKLPEGTEMVMPGDNIAMEVIFCPQLQWIRFKICNQKVEEQLAGVVAEIIE